MANVGELVDKIVNTIIQLIKCTNERAQSSTNKSQFTEDEKNNLKQILQMLEMENKRVIDQRVSTIIKIIHLLLDCTDDDVDDSDDEDGADETTSDKGRNIIQDMLPILELLNTNLTQNQNIDANLLSSYNFKSRRKGDKKRRNQYRGRSRNPSERRGRPKNSKEEGSKCSEHEETKGKKWSQETVESKHIYDFKVEENMMGVLIGKKYSNINKARNVEGIDRVIITGNRCKIMGQTEEAVNEARSILELRVEKKIPKNDEASTSVGMQQLKITTKSKCKDEFEVEEGKMRLLIGAKGSNIEKARNIEGIDEIVIKDNKICKIMGQNMKAIKEAKNMLQFSEEKIFVNKDLVGRFIGKKGVMIEKLKSESGLKTIKVLDKQNDHPAKVAVALIGSDESIKRARTLIEEFIKYYGPSGTTLSNFDTSPTTSLSSCSYTTSSSSNFGSLQSTLRQEVRPSPSATTVGSLTHTTSSSTSSTKSKPIIHQYNFSSHMNQQQQQPRFSNIRIEKRKKSPSCCIL